MNSCVKVKSNKISLLDTTLRDGSYAVDFQFSKELVIELLKKINSASIELVEVGHGLGLEAESTGVKASNIDIKEWSRFCNQYLTTSKWGMLAQPRFSKLSTLQWLCNEGMSFIRIGVEAQDIISNLDYIDACVNLNKDVYLNIMKCSNVELSDFKHYLKLIPAQVKGVYIVDSCGAMFPETVKEYVYIAKELFDCVGFHGHDNLGLANANSLAAINAGATIIDGTLNGIGRGSGNAITESLAAIMCTKYNRNYDYNGLCGLATYASKQLSPQKNDRSLQVLGGIYSIHTSFFPLIENFAQEFKVDSYSIMKLASKLSPYGITKSVIKDAANQISLENNFIS